LRSVHYYVRDCIDVKHAILLSMLDVDATDIAAANDSNFDWLSSHDLTHPFYATSLARRRSLVAARHAQPVGRYGKYHPAPDASNLSYKSSAINVDFFLDWPVDEIAAALETTRSGVNSTLHRARATLRHTYQGTGPETVAPAADAATRRLERYVRAWEAGDGAALAGLLCEEVRLSMDAAQSDAGGAVSRRGPRGFASPVRDET
jgi:hypothetical protein